MKTKKNLTTKIAASLALFAILISIVGTMILYFVSLNNTNVTNQPNPNEISSEELLEIINNNAESQVIDTSENNKQTDVSVETINVDEPNNDTNTTENTPVENTEVKEVSDTVS